MRQLVGNITVLSGLILATTACGLKPVGSQTESLTGPDYQGKKYYFGWGLNGNGVDEMDNEVKYDVLHTHDVFTKKIGGDYIGSTLIGDDVSESGIRHEWASLADKMGTQDMYLQYSSGHGYEGGLAVGVDYDDLINAALGMPAQEVVVFTMACYSGGLVDAFNEVKDRWRDYPKQGKTLFVMASSKADEESSTGPGTDTDEPDGSDGSAGSAYGHALWKALIGYADKVDHGGDGNGIVTLDEITKYVVAETVKAGGHTPVFTGAYNPQLPIAQVPTVDQVADMLGSSKEGRLRLQELINDGVLR